MKRRVMKFSMVAVLAVSFAFTSAAVLGQNSNTATGEMKQTGSETKQAGKSMAKHVRRGRIVKGGKHFGKHIGKAGKHFGKGTKRVVKKVVS